MDSKMEFWPFTEVPALNSSRQSINLLARLQEHFDLEGCLGQRTSELPKWLEPAVFSCCFQTLYSGGSNSVEWDATDLLESGNVAISKQSPSIVPFGIFSLSSDLLLRVASKPKFEDVLVACRPCVLIDPAQPFADL